MSRNVFDDSRDDALRDALRAAVPPPPLDEIAWHRLQERITAAAQPHFHRDRTGTERLAPWWQPLAGWSGRGIPLAAAATVLLMLGAGMLGTRAGTEADVPAFHTLEEELAYGVATGTRPLLTELETDAMLDVALFYEGEDW